MRSALQLCIIVKQAGFHRGSTFASKTVRIRSSAWMSTATAAPDIVVTKSTDSPGESELLTVTSSCAERIKELSSKKLQDSVETDRYYLRVFVDAGGCSGFQYKFDLENDDLIEDDDIVFQKDDARVIVDQSSLNILRGSTVDFVQEMIRSSFIIKDNPQSESACGCGTSFAVKNFESNPARD